MEKKVDIVLILSAVDKMTRVLDESINKASARLSRFQKDADNIARKSFDTGRNSAMISAAMLAPVGLAVKQFATFEESALNLKSTMLEAGGVVNKNYDAVNNLAVKLGNELKGNTSDFQKMFATMISGGVSSESILNGVGRSAAYLGNVLDVNYNVAAAFSSKIKEASGIADKDMMSMLDTFTRIAQVMPGGDSATKISDLEEAFARSGGQLKNFGIQGLEAGKQVSTLFAMLIRSGAHGETVGTGFSKILESFYDKKKMAAFNSAATNVGLQFDFIDKKTGEFKGVENMVSQFDKMKNLNTMQRQSLITALMGDGQDANFVKIFSNLGIEGYNAMAKAMNKQGTLEQRVKLIQSGLGYQWEASVGNLENTMAKIGESLKPTLVSLITQLNEFLTRLNDFIKEHPGLTEKIAKWALGLGAAFAAISAAAITVGGIATSLATISKVLGPVLATGGGAAVATSAVVNGGSVAGAGSAAAAAGTAGKIATGFGGRLVGFLGKALGKIAIPIATLQGLNELRHDYNAKGVKGVAGKMASTYGDTMLNLFGGYFAKPLLNKFLKPPALKQNPTGSAMGMIKPNAIGAVNSLLNINKLTDKLSPKGLIPSKTNSDNFTLHYNPTVTLGGNQTPTDFIPILKAHTKEIMRMWEDNQKNKQRLSFAH